MNRIAALVLLSTLGPAAAADWQLQPDASSVAFVSVKNGSVAEAHVFHDLSGHVDADGARLEIELASVDTAIPIRNERMREMLFEIADFPQAVFTTSLDTRAADDIEVGTSELHEVVGTLELHGESQEVTAQLMVTRASIDRLLVSTTRPVILDAAGYELVEGVQRLREVAGLDAIAPMVPVTLTLSFERERSGAADMGY